MHLPDMSSVDCNIIASNFSTTSVKTDITSLLLSFRLATWVGVILKAIVPSTVRGWAISTRSFRDEMIQKQSHFFFVHFHSLIFFHFCFVLQTNLPTKQTGRKIQLFAKHCKTLTKRGIVVCCKVEVMHYNPARMFKDENMNIQYELTE